MIQLIDILLYKGYNTSRNTNGLLISSLDSTEIAISVNDRSNRPHRKCIMTIKLWLSNPNERKPAALFSCYP